MNAALVGASHEEAQRFVSTLFETRPLYDSSDVSTYCQSAEYEALNRPRGFIIKKVEEKVRNILLQRSDVDWPSECVIKTRKNLAHEKQKAALKSGLLHR